eukprot:s728_g2.t1
MRNLTTKETKDIEVPADVAMSTPPGSAHGDQGVGSTKDHSAVLTIVKVDETNSKFDGYQLELPPFPTRLTPLLRNMSVGDLHALLEVFQTKVIPAATFPRLLECYGLTMQRLKHEEMWSVPHVKKQDATQLHHLAPGPRPKMVCKECKAPWPESRPPSGTCLMCQQSSSCELDSLQDFKLDANGTTWLLTITTNGVCWKALGPDGEVSEDLTKSLKAQGAVDVGAMGHNIKTPEVQNPKETSFSDYAQPGLQVIHALQEGAHSIPDKEAHGAQVLRHLELSKLQGYLKRKFESDSPGGDTWSQLVQAQGPLEEAKHRNQLIQTSGAFKKDQLCPLAMEETPLWSDQIQRILESNHLLSTASLNWISESDKSEAMEQQLSFKSLIQNQQNPCPNSRVLEEVPECKLDMFQMVEGSSSADGEVDHPTTQPQLARKLPPGSMERKLAILESLNNTYMGQVRCWGGRWVKVWQPMEVPTWAPPSDATHLQALERTTLIRALASHAQDPDSGYPQILVEGEFTAEIAATFEEEKLLDMVLGPFTQQEAACGCHPNELCPGPMAGIQESDKVRTVFDGTWGGANTHIQANTKERPPTVMDCVQALHWLHAVSQCASRSANGEQGGHTGQVEYTPKRHGLALTQSRYHQGTQEDQSPQT